jgi:hypothetical protein
MCPVMYVRGAIHADSGRRERHDRIPSDVWSEYAWHDTLYDILQSMDIVTLDKRRKIS